MEETSLRFLTPRLNPSMAEIQARRGKGWVKKRPDSMKSLAESSSASQWEEQSVRECPSQEPMKEEHEGTT